MDYTDKGKGCCNEFEETEEQSKMPPHRHSPQQRQILQEFFKRNPCPNEDHRQQLSKELGLEPKQIKYWFQNKRTQSKVENDRETLNALRGENVRIHLQNMTMREALKYPKCPACDDSPSEEQVLQSLMSENAWLKNEHKRVCDIFFSLRPI